MHLARQDGAALVVVAVEGPLAQFDGNTVGEIRNEHERRQRDCRRWLRTAEAYADDHGVRARTEILTGKLTWQLANAANAYHADLVVVGHASRGVWRRLYRRDGRPGEPLRPLPGPHRVVATRS